MQKKVKDENSWDYEWAYASDGEYPPGMTYSSIEDTGKGLTVVNANLSFAGAEGPGDSELFVRCGIAGRFSSPQFIITESKGKGFKVYYSSDYLVTSAPGSVTQICPIEEVESIRMAYIDGVATACVNDTYELSGPGLVNNQYLNETAIACADSATITDLTAIKFRRL